MKFGPLPTGEAEGTILAHCLRINGLRLPKGRWLSAADIEALQGAGIASVNVAQLQSGDLHEDEAATRIASALAGPGLIQDAAATGRVNLRAEGPGIVAVDASAIHRVNRINPAITVATVPEWTRLGPRGLAVTVKIIPFAAAEADVAAACAAGQGAVALKAPEIPSATLIETQIGDAPMPDKGRRAMKARLDRLDVALSPRCVVPHRIDAIAAAIRAAPGALVLILTGSATSDARDTAPESVRAADGVISHYGMPVDPGNLLFIGTAQDRPVIGLPGCARSPAMNGADWVLERVICGVPVAPEDIMGMGVGGLLKEIPTRPRPRDA
ncbi:molybdopterin-binding protein [Gymnodinialimonas sp. 2305UL16-5]|uniref:molybdopterin-binding protein n=1 Tax=Gymnodinialimonas mytili TaxID=3126503 RepID=UPI003099BC46